MASDRFWNRIAEQYAARPVADVPAYHRKLEATKERLRNTDVALDLGCGTGSLALELAPHVRELHALDISRGMLEIAERKVAAAGVENITFHRGTLLDSAFEGGSFDVVCAYNILHLVDDRRVTLDKIFELLKPGGLLVSTTPCLGESRMPFGLLIPAMHMLGKAPAVVEVIKAHDLQASLAAAGFTHIDRISVTTKKTTAFSLAKKPAH